ncbi:vWA domain-containing protein [uncultured Hyphomicrobium sp.]|uniref:vWA domain-containing protein n=1 Tax=uncultured Hyphomicrobium sp. TaxID=194373 RepID=UPI0025F14367|nr:vWA domain-containing protein [uncultured Hyphomicrobium sp.]
MRERLDDARFWTLLAATALTCLAILLPRVTLTRDVYDLLVIVDITGSMTTRDMSVAGKPASRLDAAKAALERLVADLPCQSRLGLGVFTERRSFLLFNPIDVCADFAPLETAIQNLDWRMAWEGDSMVAKGLYHAVEIAADLKADLVFVTDGHEAPPLPSGGALPEFEGTPGKVLGLVIGAGGTDKVPMPKYDDDGNEIGTYGPMDVPQENHSGPPPPDAHLRPGYHPKWAPFGSDVPQGEEHLSSVKSEHLAAIAARVGLAHADLITSPDLLSAITSNAHPRPVEVAVDIRPLAAALALALLVALYAAPLIARRIPIGI